MPNNNGLPILRLELWKTSNGTRNMKNINFVPEDIHGIYHHIKFLKSIMNGMCSV